MPSETLSPAGSLDLHEGLAPRRRLTGCHRWPKHLRLRSSSGRFVKGRCKATNRCDYCAVLSAVEAAEMIALDAMTDAPGLLMVLTTPEATDTPDDRYRLARQHVARDLRRSFPDFQYASLLEWTTGYAARSGGLRRPHWNWMCKGVPVSESDRVRQTVEAIWCRGVGASPRAQHVGPIYAAGGLTRYLAMHFLKASQAPPPGFTGQRFNCSEGYFADRTRREARIAARESLRSKRALWRALAAGFTGHEAELVAQLEVISSGDDDWRLVQVIEHIGDLVVSAVEVGGRSRQRERVMA